MIIDDFLPQVLPRAKGCAAPIATQAIRNALIELCRDSLVWREFQTSINTVALQTAYAYAPAAGQQVMKLLSLTLNGEDVGIVDAVNGRLKDGMADAGPYVYGTFAGFELRPAQAAALPIVTYSAVAPSNTATTLPDAFNRYIELVAKGALYRLFSSPELACHNTAAAEGMLKQWMDGKGDVKTDAMTGNTRATPRSSPRWF